MGGGGKLIGPPPGSAAASSSSGPRPRAAAASSAARTTARGAARGSGNRRGGPRSSAHAVAVASAVAEGGTGTSATAPSLSSSFAGGKHSYEGAGAAAAVAAASASSSSGAFGRFDREAAGGGGGGIGDDDPAEEGAREESVGRPGGHESDRYREHDAPRLLGPLPGSEEDVATRPSRGCHRIREYDGINTSTSTYVSTGASAGRRKRGDAKKDDGDDTAKIYVPQSDAERQFLQRLREQHRLELYPIEGDGNCLFRAISLQVYGDENMHEEVRKQILDFMEREEDHFTNFVVADEEEEKEDRNEGYHVESAYGDHKHNNNNNNNNNNNHGNTRETFRQYIARKRQNGVHGNHPEIQAASELYNRTVQVYVPSRQSTLPPEGAASATVIEPINIFHQDYRNNSDPPIRLSYHDGNHYNAIVDPNLPTAGVGLGLPGLEPGLADRMQLEKAKGESERTAVEMEEERLRWAVEKSEREAEREERERLREVMRESRGVVLGAGVGAVGSSFEDEDEDEVEFDEDVQVKEALRQSALAMEDVYKKKALYLSELDAADFDLEQAVLASSLESYRKAEQERKQPSSRRGDGRRKRQNPSPTSPQRSSTNSPVHRSTATVAAAPTSSNTSSVASYPRSSSPYINTNNNYFNTDYYSNYDVDNNNVNNVNIRNSHAASSSANNPNPDTSTDEYPPSVQELVMNGFELSKVLHAYDLIGDNFDDLLSFLISSAGAS